MLNTLLKKIGRRKAGSWGPPRKKHLKRIANRAARKAVLRKLEIEHMAAW